jgi:hypothetical protein
MNNKLNEQSETNKIETIFSSVWLFCQFCILQKIRHYYQERLHIDFLSDTTDNTIIIIVTQSTTNSLKVKTTIIGQGGIIPRENTWGEHVVVEYNGNIYDPSYGLEYGSITSALLTFINQSVESIGIGRLPTQTEDTLDYGWVYVAQIGPIYPDNFILN